jgi:uncharacterized membrane protein
VLIVGSVLYPGFVYFGLGHVAPGAILAVALALGGVRLVMARGRGAVLGFVILAVALGGLLLVRPMLAVQAYPVLVSLGFAAAFAWSLAFPPTVIERLARLREPDLPADGAAYTRRLTGVWVVFLLGNAAVTAGLALWGSLAAWTLWTGLISYLLMGALFGGEWLLRGWLRGRRTV